LVVAAFVTAPPLS
jgi:hypothetical protein